MPKVQKQPIRIELSVVAHFEKSVVHFPVARILAAVVQFWTTAK
jgi:hypothetical protein